MQLCSTWHSVATLLPIPLDNNTRAWAQDILRTCPSLFKPFDVLVLPTSWRICSGRDGECRVHRDAVQVVAKVLVNGDLRDNNLRSAIHMHDLQMAHLAVEANAELGDQVLLPRVQCKACQWRHPKRTGMKTT